MIEKLGPAVCWALYLAMCQLAAPELLPFLFWCLMFVLAVWVCYLGVMNENSPRPLLPKAPPPEPHHSTLTGGQCFGEPKFMEYRKFQKDGGEYLEITRQCPACKMLFFEKKPK